MEFEIFDLGNGIRVVHKQIARPVAHLSLHIGAGSRDEAPHEQGLAHFLEHCLFKGTQKRRPYHILSRMEDAGGELNAYTGKEETVIHTSFLKGEYARAAELIADITFQSTFPEKEIQKEKEVIIDEIHSYRDNPSESIFDDFEELIFPDHAIGRNILGTVDTVRSFKREDLLNYTSSQYGCNRIVIGSIGDISSARLQKLLEKEMGQRPVPELPRGKKTPQGIRGKHEMAERPIHQTHAILGGAAYSANQRKSRVLMLLNNLLGGPGMNSRLNLNIREKYGFTYYLESFYQPYSDAGLFGIYLATDPGTVDKAVELIYKELRKLKNEALGVMQLRKAKRQLLGQIAMAQENNAALGLAYGKSLLTFDKIDTFQTISEKIDAIDSQQILEVANEIFEESAMNSLVYKSAV